MEIIKKAGIIGGAVIGGVIGGTLSVVGAVSKRKILDELGESIIDSCIMTGDIVGDLAGGTADMVVGKFSKDEKRVESGKLDLRTGGGKIADNIIENVKVTIDNGKEIITGLKEGDRDRAAAGAKTFLKLAAVGAITVGAVKLSEEDEESDT